MAVQGVVLIKRASQLLDITSSFPETDALTLGKDWAMISILVDQHVAILVDDSFGYLFQDCLHVVMLYLVLVAIEDELSAASERGGETLVDELDDELLVRGAVSLEQCCGRLV